jgi:NADP-dependent 3-hydroxy acid dehydrogenase YdfG
VDVEGKVLLITGASAGIGLATARRFAAAGARVALAARSVEKLARIEDELRKLGHETVALPADLRNKLDVNRLVEATFQYFGQIDILINNAGQAASGMVADVSIDHYRQVIELNMLGPLYAMQAVIPKMRQTGGGIIINVSSMVSKMHIPALAAYASTKAALNMLSDTARVELAPDNIRVITVYPRITATEFGVNSLGSQQMRHQQRSGVSAGNPPDSAEFVAEKILEAAVSEPAEQYMDS